MLQLVLDKSKPYVLFDFPNYSNVGDSAIWQGEIKALDWFFGKPPQHTCQLLPKAVSLPKLNKGTQIVLQGGGNLGDLWEAHQLFRERVLVSYPQNRIVQMPQSIFFKDESKKDRCKSIFSAHQDFHLMTRDQTSFEIAKRLHHGPTHLVPDFALALGQIPRPCAPKVPIFCLMRTDQEKLVSCENGVPEQFVVEDWIHEPGYVEVRILRYMNKLDHMLPSSRIVLDRLRTALFNRIADIRVKRGCLLLSQGQVVITDRLHAHILCSLMDIPHVVLDNSYGKIGGFRKAWGTGGDLVLEASDFEDAISKANFMFHEKCVN